MLAESKENGEIHKYDGYGWIRAVCLSPELADSAPMEDIGNSESEIWKDCGLEYFDKAWDYFTNRFPQFAKYRKPSTCVKPIESSSDQIGFVVPPGWNFVFCASGYGIEPNQINDDSFGMNDIFAEDMEDCDAMKGGELLSDENNDVGKSRDRILTIREIMAPGDENRDRAKVLTEEISRRESAIAYWINEFRFAVFMYLKKLDALEAGEIRFDEIVKEFAVDVEFFIANIPIMRERLNGINDMYESAMRLDREKVFRAKKSMRRFFHDFGFSAKMVADFVEEAKEKYYLPCCALQSSARKEMCQKLESDIGMPIEDFIKAFKRILRADEERAALRKELEEELSKKRKS